MNTIAYLLIFVVTCCHLSGQLILKRGINSIGASGDAGGIINFLLQVLQSPHVWVALCFQGLGYILWFYVLRIANVSVAFALSGAFFYVLLGIMSWIFLGERLGQVQWIGIFLITAGVLCLTLNSNISG